MPLIAAQSSHAAITRGLASLNLISPLRNKERSGQRKIGKERLSSSSFASTYRTSPNRRSTYAWPMICATIAWMRNPGCRSIACSKRWERDKASCCLLDRHPTLTVTLRTAWWKYAPSQLLRLHDRYHARPVTSRALPLLDGLFRPTSFAAAHL
jgi:hypothetical protein